MKTDLKSLKQQFVTKWIAKKSRKPFCSGSLPPAVNVKNVTYDKGKKRFYFRVSANKGILIDKNIQESVEIISREEALKLRELYFNSRSLSQNLQTSGSCYRTDTGEKKKDFEEDSFQAALYELRHKFPEADCQAYTCSECGKIHIGKAG